MLSSSFSEVLQCIPMIRLFFNLLSGIAGIFHVNCYVSSLEQSFSFRFFQGDFSVECLFNACQSTNECLQFYLKIIARSNEEAGTEATGMRNRVIP